MADDIDIEEHDVLDNPRIKNIFPDITSIKTEVIDYEEEENIDFDNENYEYYQHDSISEDFDEDMPNLYQNKIILGTKPCASSEPSDDEGETVPNVLESSVVLEDWGALLLNSPCYCRSCQILFPTENALDSHKMTAHSFLVAVGNNKAIKSTSKSSISARLQFESDSNSLGQKENLCSHCNQIFPDEIALLKHSYELIPRKFGCDSCNLVFDSEVAFKIHKMTHPDVIVLCCPICTCHFKYSTKLIAHMSNQHKIELTNLPERVKTKYICDFCGNKTKDNKGHNNHISYRHSELYNKIVNDKNENDKFKCNPCNLTFPSAYSEKIHRAAQHATKTTDILTKRSCDLEHQIKIEPLSPKNPLPQKPDFTQRSFPKSTLFKCNKCQLHFVSSLVANEHTKRCVLKKGEWKCKKCRRSFKLIDRQIHNIQHEMTDRFRIIVIQENILNSILCRCRSCKICYDERTLLKYHAKGCTESNSVLCNLCNSRVHEHAITKHKRIHNELGSEQFLIVDYTSLDKLEPKTSKSKKRQIKMEYRKDKFYFYCPTCHCYMKINKLPDKHSVGKCNKHIKKRLCKLCGLLFSTKGIVTHKKEHKKFPNLKLSDFTFKSTQSGKQISPPFPDFKKCRTCNVIFFSNVALRSHVCNVEEAKSCGYCGEKFSDLAYKLHVAFHEYSGSDKKKVYRENIPELIKKYESLKIIWNILFLCETCDTILDSYDEVVEHSQNHFCNMESYNVTIIHCNKCDLKIVEKCYEKHKKLHSADTVTKSSFKILRYKYDTLLSENWNDMFKTLAKEQVDQILNTSKYKHTRSVRMELLVDGPIDVTLYQCDVCNLIVDCSDVAEHAKNSDNCVNPMKFTCSKCHLDFATKNFLDAHEYMHGNRQIDNKNIRIISFNNEKDLYINDSLRSKMNPEGLKFIRCQHCGKLINKAKYNKHVIHHRYYEKNKKKFVSNNKKIGNQPKFVARSKFKKIEKSVHNFYKCRKCGVCVLNIHKHFCSLTHQKRQCPKCHLWFRSTHLTKHFMYHEKYRLTKSNVNVFNFKNGKIEKERRKVVQVTLYQCSECNVCLHQESNIKRHICIASNYQKVCRLCDMPFHCTRMQLHENFHEDKTFTKKNVVIKKFKSNSALNECYQRPKQNPTKPPPNTFTRKPKQIKESAKTKYAPNTELTNRQFRRHVHNRFYKCATCKLLFITSSALLEHVNSCPNDNTGVMCNKCGLVFHKNTINLHKKINKCPTKTTVLYIITLEGNGVKYDDTKNLYRCDKCEISYLTFRAVLNHIEGHHVVILKTVNCDVCGTLLSKRSYAKHKLMHHVHRKLTINDLNKFIVVDMNLSKALTDLPDKDLVDITVFVPKENEPDPVKRVGRRKLGLDGLVKLQLDSDNTQTQNKYILFPCEICNLNFLHKRTLLLHSNGCHDETKHDCSKCGLKFTKNTLTRHLKLHHNSPNDSMNNDKTNSSEIEQTNDNISSEIEKSEIVVDTEKQQTQQPNKTTNKLYKCSICDVYFLFQDACRDHVTDHTTLDPTEYIACKMCDLQFLCEYLGSHMKCHREKSFNIDETIVEEYQFNDGVIKMDSYPAVDRLKSKLVTTTTHFDTEDEKNDESTIDSTVSVTESKTFSDSVVSNENSVNNEGTSDVEMVSANSDAEKVLEVRSSFCFSPKSSTSRE